MSHNVFWSPGMTLDYMERSVIEAALNFYRGNKTMAAAALGISIRTIQNKLERYEVEDKQQHERREAARRKEEEFALRCRGANFTQVYPHQPAIPRSQPSPKSDALSTAEHEVSVPERDEVQEVLPEQVTNLRPKKRS